MVTLPVVKASLTVRVRVRPASSSSILVMVKSLPPRVAVKADIAGRLSASKVRSKVTLSVLLLVSMPKVETIGLSRVSPENNRVLLATLALPAPSVCTAESTCMLAFLALRSSAKSGVNVAVKPISDVTKLLNPPPMTLISDCSSMAFRGSE